MAKQVIPTESTTRVFLFDYNLSSPNAPLARAGQNARFFQKIARGEYQLDMKVQNYSGNSPRGCSVAKEVESGVYDFLGITRGSDLANEALICAMDADMDMKRILVLNPTPGYHPARSGDSNYRGTTNYGATTMKIAPDGHFSPVDLAHMISYMQEVAGIEKLTTREVKR